MIGQAKFRQIFREKSLGGEGAGSYTQVESVDGSRRSMTRAERDDPTALSRGSRVFANDNLTSQSMGREKGEGAASWFPDVAGGGCFGRRCRFVGRRTKLGWRACVQRAA